MGYTVNIYIYIHVYICTVYIYTWKAIKTKFSVRTGLDIFFVRYVFFPNTAMSGCKPSTYTSIVFLCFPEILDLSDWFRQYECLV